MNIYTTNFKLNNSFKDWWIKNKSKIEKVSRWWLLPRGLKIAVKIIIAAIDIYLETDSNTIIDTVALKDINVDKIDIKWI